MYDSEFFNTFYLSKELLYFYYYLTNLQCLTTHLAYSYLDNCGINQYIFLGYVFIVAVYSHCFS